MELVYLSAKPMMIIHSKGPTTFPFIWIRFKYTHLFRIFDSLNVANLTFLQVSKSIISVACDFSVSYFGCFTFVLFNLFSALQMKGFESCALLGKGNSNGTRVGMGNFDVITTGRQF